MTEFVTLLPAVPAQPERDAPIWLFPLAPVRGVCVKLRDRKRGRKRKGGRHNERKEERDNQREREREGEEGRESGRVVGVQGSFHRM